MKRFLCLSVLSIVLPGCSQTQEEKIVYKSDTLSISQLSAHTYRHVSYLDAEGYGKVTCNGMIVCDGGEAIVLDTPTDDEASSELINWVTESLDCKITAIIPTHYHVDNLGGLNEFHRRGIPSYAYAKTILIAEENDYPQPRHGFDGRLELKVGHENVYVEFLGEGHTCDNVVGYFPAEGILFGGCLIKEAGAGKGNLEEASVDQWAKTVEKVKMKYPDTKKVIPGHGKPAGPELLDYTISLFGSAY